jgi:hypothetical protein
MFDIKITGLDEAIKKVENMAHGLTEKGLNEYCDKIKDDIYTKCNLKKGEVKLEAKKNGDNITIDFNVNSSKLTCVKSAIQTNLTHMPITTKAFFEQLIKSIDKKILEFKDTQKS